MLHGVSAVLFKQAIVGAVPAVCHGGTTDNRGAKAYFRMNSSRFIHQKACLNYLMSRKTPGRGFFSVVPIALRNINFN